MIEGVNPYGTRRAALLVGGDNMYLYLSNLTRTGKGTDGGAPTIAAVWVANLGLAPDDLQPATTGEDGEPPVMGREGTAFPRGCPPPEGPLELVWFEEGDGVAVLDNDGLLAVIPGWGGKDDFSGYARYCRDQTPVAWPLGPWPAPRSTTR